MTKTDIGIYRGLKEKYNPEEHIGFFITTDTGELLIGDQSLGLTISEWKIEDGVLTLTLNTGREVVITFPEATETVKGLLSAEDKAQLVALQGNLDGKVDKVTGKSLVLDSEITKLAGLPNSTELTNSIANAKTSGDNAQSDLNAHKANTSNPHQINASQVGLGNVTNDAQVKRVEMGAAQGVATLDENGKVPTEQLPSYVDDVIDVYATYTKSDTGTLTNVTLYSDSAKTQLITGESGKIYLNVADGELGYLFRWTGSVFAQTGASSLILGEVTGTAYDGAKGKANADNIAKIKGTQLSHIKDNESVTTTPDKVLINYECYTGELYGATGTSHTADIPSATTSKAGVMSATDKTKLDGVEIGAQKNTVTSVAGKTGAVTLNKSDVGLGNVDNTSDVNKPVSTAQATAIADAKKAGTDAQADLDAYKATNDKAVSDLSTELADHKADKDKKHIPDGGHERQVLSWKDSGEAKWEDMSNLFTGLEELLAYGVEWDTTVGTPTITRIGNMSLHKSLPIQSQLKGCIAQKDKVIYWLNETDWRFRKDAITESVTLAIADSVYTLTADVFGTKLYEKQWIKINNVPCQIDSIDTNTKIATLVTNDALVALGLTDGPISIELGAVLNGYDGTVRVYCPNFYIKSVIDGVKRRVWLSTVKIDNTWTYQHEILIDAYRGTVLNTVPTNMGYLSTLPTNSAISVVNTNGYCRGGGNRSSYDTYLATDPFRTDLGKPRTGISRPTMRIFSRNGGSEILSYDQYKNIFYWLYVVEYANFNCLAAFNGELTSEGYHQGGLGDGVTTWNTNTWSRYNSAWPLTPCGYGNELGNFTGIKTLVIPETVVNETTTVASKTFQVPRWRGFDNPFGDIWTNLDGIIIDADADNHPNNMNYVFTCQDPAKYADSLNDGYEKVGEEIHQSGYTKEFDLGDAAHTIPNVIGGGGTSFKCDYHWVGSKDAVLRLFYVGGCTAGGSNAGLGEFHSDYNITFGLAHIGFRLASAFVSLGEQ